MNPNLIRAPGLTTSSQKIQKTEEQVSLYHSNAISYGTNNLVSSKMTARGFPGGAVVENLPANAGDTGSSPGLGRSHMPRSN